MKVEVWSDVVCPWCYIGKRRLEQALETFEHADQVEVVWRSYELQPGAHRSDDLRGAANLANKFGVSLEQAQAMEDRVSATAAEVGLDYHLDLTRTTNTFDAHRLLHFAAETGKQDALKERLLKAHFTQGQDAQDHDVLADLAAEVGIDRDAAAAVLADDVAFAESVRADEAEAQALGANGVPFFVFDRTYGISGAQPVEHFKEVLTKVWAEANPIQMLSPASGTDVAGNACADDNCAV